MTMAVFTQVYAAQARYYQSAKILKDAADYHEVQSKILRQVKTSVSVDAATEQALIREEMNTLLATVKYDMAHADLQNAFAGVHASIGNDPFSAGLNGDESVGIMAGKLRQLWIERGDRSGS
jgi:superfamily I DNA and RNA helicase